MELHCSECDTEFEHDFPFGDDVQCANCGVWLRTEMEESGDSLFAWVIGKSDNQRAVPNVKVRGRPLLGDPS